MASILKRVFHRLHFEYLKQRIGSISKLEERLRISFKEKLSPLKFKDEYDHYVSHISRADMAASLELANVVSALCSVQQPNQAVDLGSGFSSFVLRSYAKENPATRIFSIDDDLAWLEKTKLYLQHLKLNTENLLTLDEFVQKKDLFDLTLLDLNYVEVRKNYIKLVVERCSSGGLILFDDVHKREFMTEVLEQTRNLPIKLYDLRPVTQDGFGRFAMLGIKD